MMLKASLLLVSLLPLSGLAQQIPVVGAPTEGSTIPPPRRNINDLYNEGGAEWDLLVLGMTSMQEQSETDQLSYFQLMGIHGAPYRAWNGVNGVSGGGYGGYCCHGDVCFGLWHRPFMALYEQTLYTHVQRIAASFRGRSAATYQAAARRLRFPYWDWVVDARLPPSVSSPRVVVNTPQAGRQEVRNPLYSYRFRRPFSELGMPLDFLGSRFNETKRGPRADGTEDIDEVNAQLVRYGPTLRGQVYNVFTETTTFESMATDSTPGASFESPHNAIHNFAGWGGHLVSVDWSAFDPAFALHHGNVDRLVALWQAINPNNAIFNTTVWTNGQFASPPGNTFTADTPLRPFFASSRAGDFHTSRSVVDVRTLGYTYPELVGTAGQTPEERSRTVRARVNALYGPTANSSQRTSVAVAGGRGPRETREYQLVVQADREKLDLPARVSVYTTSGRLAGHAALMATPRTGTSHTVLPLDELLAELGTEDWGEEAVLRRLKGGFFRVEVRRYDGKQLSAEAVRLEVQSRAYTPRRDDGDFPTFGPASRVAVPVSA